LADEVEGTPHKAIVLYPGAMATDLGGLLPGEREEVGEANEVPADPGAPPERVADLIAWVARVRRAVSC
jgi:NAD(P)-dependent dehydrogenase (short-subunit alcohol dehydrogenase family)